MRCLFCCEGAIKKIFLLIFIWAWTLAQLFYNKLLFDYKEKSYINFQPFHYSLLLITSAKNRQGLSEEWRVKSEKVKSTSFCRNLSIFGGTDGNLNKSAPKCEQVVAHSWKTPFCARAHKTSRRAAAFLSSAIAFVRGRAKCGLGDGFCFTVSAQIKNTEPKARYFCE